MSRSHAGRRGFTLIELLVVTAIIVVLIALSLPALQQSWAASHRAQCQNNLRQIGLALHNYHGTHDVFPPGGMIANELSWHVLVLPQLEHSSLYAAFDFDKGPYFSAAVNNKNNPHGLVRIPQYLCPSGPEERSLTSADAVGDEHTYTTHYYGIMGPRGQNPAGGEYQIAPGFGPFSEHGILGYESSKRFGDLTDGASNSFVVGEISWKDASGYRTWVRGVNGNPMSGCKNVLEPIHVKFFNNGAGFNDISLGSEHPGGTYVLMGDGGVRFVSEAVDLVVYKSTASINGGEAEVLSF